MSEPIKQTIDNKQICIYKCGAENAPTVYANMYMEAGGAILDKCEKLGCAPFDLVSISELRWDEELSPWPHGPVGNNGKAEPPRDRGIFDGRPFRAVRAVCYGRVFGGGVRLGLALVPEIREVRQNARLCQKARRGLSLPRRHRKPNKKQISEPNRAPHRGTMLLL